MPHLTKIHKYGQLTVICLGVLLCLLACSYNNTLFNKNTDVLSIAAMYPAGDIPDGVILTMAAEPATMQTVNWRTSGENKVGVIRFRELTSDGSLPFIKKTARVSTLETPEIVDDPLNSRFTVTLKDLKPDTVYEYWVANGTLEVWAGPYQFKTAPALKTPFSFIYVGDFQEGLDATGVMLNDIAQKYPETGFFMASGDFANSGSNRNDWDQIIAVAGNVWANFALAPALGNHDLSMHSGATARMYFNYFSLPPNGPADVSPNHAYSFTYGDACFFVLDSNDKLLLQLAWLEQQLQKPEIQRYKWKIVMLHHPVYNIKASRRNTLVHDIFMPVFDEYGVYLVLSGHDHGYMRSKILKNDLEVPAGKSGTVYVVSNAGGKIYSVEHIRSKAAITIGGMQMYQKIDIGTDENGNACLKFRAYDAGHNLVDEFTLIK